MSEAERATALLPWRVGEDFSLDGVPFIPVIDANGSVVCEVVATGTDGPGDLRIVGRDRRAAALIVRAVNAQSDIAAGLRDLIDEWPDVTARTWRTAKSALAKAGES